MASGEIPDEIMNGKYELKMMDPEDEHLIRWVAMLLIEGKSPTEIRRNLSENMLSDSRLSPDAWKSLLLASIDQANSLKQLVISKAELGNTDWLRLDSYSRRKKNLERLDRLVERAESEADSISKMNTVSFMIGGLTKAQESMDKFTGAQEAAPQVQINIGYDPMDQFREVIQSESRAEPIEIKPISDEEE
tara:strand:+ start:375 stop:947 length:573 start_codon:yes stop_codon:yes gene_type:complete